MRIVDLSPGTKVRQIEWTSSSGEVHDIEVGRDGCIALYIVDITTGKGTSKWIADINSDGETQLHNTRFISAFTLLSDPLERNY